MAISNIRLSDNEGDGTRNWVITLLLATIILVTVLWASRQQYYYFGRSSHRHSKAKNAPFVPFVVIQKPDWKILYRAVEVYRTETMTALQKLSRSLQVALDTEEELNLQGKDLLSEMLQCRIDRLASVYDLEERLLHYQLLRPFVITRVLPHRSYRRMQQQQGRPHHHNYTTSFTMSSTTKSSALLDPLAYDSTGQVLAHIVRDWTSEGRTVRQSLYPWCIQQLKRGNNDGPVLVPGAGLGRLAYDIAVAGYRVEALELSLTMMAAAAAILQRHLCGQLHPYALDYFTNEVNSQRRYDRVDFPDVDVVKPIKGTLSYTLGDFVEVYQHQSKAQYGAVVTCFFLDTATNLYDYLETIHRILKPNGLWINVGPLQWHRNAILTASADELLGLLHGMGWEVLHWSVDRKPIEYRNAGVIRSTHYDAYCPLRFVVRKPDT